MIRMNPRPTGSILPPMEIIQRGKKVIAHCWDFGGQEITVQLVFSKSLKGKDILARYLTRQKELHYKMHKFLPTEPSRLKKQLADKQAELKAL